MPRGWVVLASAAALVATAACGDDAPATERTVERTITCVTFGAETPDADASTCLRSFLEVGRDSCSEAGVTSVRVTVKQAGYADVVGKVNCTEGLTFVFPSTTS